MVSAGRRSPYSTPKNRASFAARSLRSRNIAESAVAGAAVAVAVTAVPLGGVSGPLGDESSEEIGESGRMAKEIMKGYLKQP